MKATLFAALAAVLFTGSALADAKLAEAKQCMQCHAVDRDTIGPSFRTIKAIYKDMERREEMLIAVMRDGSSANLGPHWGRARMPDSSERPALGDREARELARWILSQ